MIKSLPLIVGEEEQLIFDDRSADRSAEHVPTHGRSCDVLPIIRPTVRVEHVVAEELKQIAVELICPGLDRCTDDTALEVTKLSRRVIGYYVELLNGIHAGGVPDIVSAPFVVVHAVENEIIGLVTVAVDEGASLGAAGVAAGRRLGLVHAGRVDGDTAGRQESQLDVVARGQRQPEFRRRVNDGADLGGLRLEQRGLSGDLDGLVELADSECEVHSRRLVHFQMNRGLERRLEALRLSANAIGTKRQTGQHVEPAAVALRAPDGVTVEIGSGHAGADDGRSGWVGDRAINGRGDLLSRHRRRHQTG